MLSKLFDLTGRVALVTGGSKGLGKAMAIGLAEAGAGVVIASRHEEELRAAAREIRSAGTAGVEYVVSDLSLRGEADTLAQKAIEAMGRVDILINNAGVNTPQAIDEMKDEVWDRVLELNLTSCMALTRALSPYMKERKWGRIVHLSSIMGLTSAAARNPYSATKSALLGLARASANDLGSFGITVNCIAPGPMLTDMPMSVLSKEKQDEFAQGTALLRWGRPDELVGPVLLLASDAGSYITGSVLVVDGGCLAKVF
ncbi:3-oxoacyl-[acyl-carrier-protein] reductase FabG [Aquisphaera giovannonii]|uniref:3-oxoacyl-[acyl-carrier-protein] reductase FabG n=1 Tax=Aquisphaera giovannonii TaxID=406548 RepID=A0A5B9W642_9BACT|nr:SDR family NAD(P)-dependent oxidoreductase [Aquisphaera giovannonii]QEH36146.1 3-oxoacyl-[acyl-carrier-protein] reductase FabG [Aquisphaera giovannonii]